MINKQYRDLIKDGNFTQVSNFLIDGYGLLGLNQDEFLFICYILKWVNSKRATIFDMEILRDLCWSRNRLLAVRKSLNSKCYLEFSHKNEPDGNTMGYRSTGYYYYLDGLFFALRNISSISKQEFLEKRKEQSIKCAEERRKKGRQKNFHGEKDSCTSSVNDIPKDRDFSVPKMELTNPMDGIDQSQQWAPINKLEINSKETINTSLVGDPSDHLEIESTRIQTECHNYIVPPACSESKKLTLDELEQMDFDDMTDEQIALMEELEDEEYEAKKKEMENPKDIKTAVTNWFTQEMKSPPYYIKKFLETEIDDEKLRKFWALKDNWIDYPSIQNTDKSIIIMLRNLDNFIDCYWESYSIYHEAKLRSEKDMEKLFQLHNFLNEHHILWNRNCFDDDYDKDIEPILAFYREHYLDLHADMYLSWSCNTNSFSLKEGKLLYNGKVADPDDFTKEKILAHMEELKSNLAKEKARELNPEDEKEFKEQLLKSLKEDTGYYTNSVTHFDSEFGKRLLASLNEEDN